jgi:transposase-like protein
MGSNRTTGEIKMMMAEDSDFLRPIVKTVIQEFLEAEMAEAIGAEKGERIEGRFSYRSEFVMKFSRLSISSELSTARSKICPRKDRRAGASR